jgi:hypothetical protein
MQDTRITQNAKPNNIQAAPPPNEAGGVHVQGHIKIFDPATGKVLINKRD